MDKQYAGIGSQLGPSLAAGSANAKPPQPAISSLYEAVKYMREAAANAHIVADQICGSQPESVGSGENPESSSLFGRIDDVASEIRAMATRISGDMQRIQNRL